jgi:hypothetical protein
MNFYFVWVGLDWGGTGFGGKAYGSTETKRLQNYNWSGRFTRFVKTVKLIVIEIVSK